MSRPVQIRRDIYPAMFAQIDANNPVEIPIMAQPKGMRPGIASHLRSADIAQRINAMHYEPSGVLSTGLVVLYATSIAAGHTIITTYSYRSEVERIMFAVTTEGLYYRRGDGGSFTQMTGPTISGVFVGDYFCFCPWGNTLLVTNPVVGMLEIDLVTFTYSRIADAPQDAQFVTVFNGRVVVSNLTSQPRRIQWSVKFSSSNWTGLGSGFEDLQPNNSISYNYPLVVVPIDDRKAFVFRQESCDLMSATDNFDVPFVFSQLHSGVDTRCARAVKRTDAGVVTVGTSNVYLVNLNGIEAIGTGLITSPIEHTNLDATVALRKPTSSWAGEYNPVLKEYWLKTDYTIYRYQFGFQAWVELETYDNGYPNSISAVVGTAYPAYSDLVGAYSGLTGTLDTGMMDQYRVGMLVAMDNTVHVYETDVNTNGGVVGAAIVTNDIDLVNKNKLVTITELEVDYQVYSTSKVITVEYSTDLGMTYSSYGSIVSRPDFTRNNQIGTIQKVITAKQVRFKFSFSNSAKFRVYKITLTGIEGARQLNQT